MPQPGSARVVSAHSQQDPSCALVPPAVQNPCWCRRVIGWTKARVNELIKGKRGVTADAALDLAEVLGTSARLWMNLQATYDLHEASRRRSAA